MASSAFERVVILVDMDCFYCQVEEQLDANLKNKPIAVVQYNAWRGGGIIAVNYPARDKGVTRHMRGDDAKEHCPDIHLVRVPQVRGKADLTKYRDAGKKVAEVLQTFTTLLERASVDEAYLDVTEIVRQRLNEFTDGVNKNKLPNTFVVGSSIEDFLYNISDNRDFATGHIRLAIGAVVAEEIRAEVLKETGYKCSAGIAHNKVLAKLVCGLHKPNKQTILPDDAISKLYENLPVRKIRSLGGKLGNTVSEALGIQYMGELNKFSERELIQKFDEKTGRWLYNIARGIDTEPVTTRLVSKSIGCCKKFPGRSALRTAEDVEHWIQELSLEISERLSKDVEENNRKAKQMVVSFSQEVKGQDVSSSRTHPLGSYECKRIAQNMLDIIRRFCMHADGSYHVKFLGLSVGSFEEIKKVKVITSFFKVAGNDVQPLSEQIKPSLKKDNSPGTSKILSFVNINNKRSVCSGSTSVDIGTIEELHTYSNNNNNSHSTNNYEDSNCADNEYDSDCSIWSAKTQDLNINPENLIFYEDSQSTLNNCIIPSGNKPTPVVFEANDASYQSEDSISSEIVFSNASYTPEINDQKTIDCPSFFKKYFNTKEDDQPVSRSFFQKYFDNLRNDKNSIPADRQFNTSKILESQESDDSFEDSTVETVGREAKSNDQLQDVNSCHSEDENREICTFCTKSVPKEDLLSHMDYHYALEIVKQESDLYRTQIVSSNQKKLVLKTTNKKKKQLKNDVRDTNTLTITKFFHKDVPLRESHICDECNKRIKLEDVPSHQDYHVAKKLHLDINSSKLMGPGVKNNSLTEQKNKRSKKLLQSTSISSFLKPL